MVEARGQLSKLCRTQGLCVYVHLFQFRHNCIHRCLLLVLNTCSFRFGSDADPEIGAGIYRLLQFFGLLP
jgi:hypothetical protein